MMRKLQHLFPILDWGSTYSTSNFKGDLFAGITVAVMLIPQGLAYAMLAGLPPQYGLYSAFIPGLIYGIMGTSQHLSVGPVALDSIILASGLNALSIVNSENYISTAIFLALYVGLLQIVLGGLKLGFLIHYISKPVVRGFTYAAALIIGASQLPLILGLSITDISLSSLSLSNDVEFNEFTFLVGVSGVLILLLLKRITPGFPNYVLLVVFSTLLSFVFVWEVRGVKVVGDIDRGIPYFTLPSVTSQVFIELSPLAITIALLAFMQSHTVANFLEDKSNKQFQMRPNQELIALGTSNLIGSFFNAYTVSGGLSRSVVNKKSGANTAMSSIVSALFVGMVLVFFTDYFYHLPEAILGSIIFVAVIQLIDFKYAETLWQKYRSEFYIFLFTFLATLFLGIKYGVLLGVFVSLTHMVYLHSKPHVALLGRIRGTNHFKNISRFSDEVITYPGVLIVRFDGSLFYGNQVYFKQRIEEHMQAQKEPLRYLLVDASPLNYIDATAFDMIVEWIGELREDGKKVLWAQVVGPVRDMFYKNQIINTSEEQVVFSSLDSALNYLNGISLNANEEKISNQVNLN